MGNNLFDQSQCIVEDKSLDDDNFIEQPVNNPRKMVNNPQSESLICSHCKQSKDLSEFYITTNYHHEKRGRSYTCKVCSRESARKSVAKKKLVKEAKNEVVLSSGL